MSGSGIITMIISNDMTIRIMQTGDAAIELPPEKEIENIQLSNLKKYHPGLIDKIEGQ
jgi:hypothetical protein